MAFCHRWLFCLIVVIGYVIPNKYWFDALNFTPEWQLFLRGQRSSFYGTTVSLFRLYYLPMGLYNFHGALLRYVFISILDGIRPGGWGRELCSWIGIPAPMLLFLLKVDLICRCIFTFLVNAVFREPSWRFNQRDFCADAVRSSVEAWCGQILWTWLFLIGLFETEKCVILTWLPLMLATTSLLCQALARTLRVGIQVHIERTIIIFVDPGYWWCYDGVLLYRLKRGRSRKLLLHGISVMLRESKRVVRRCSWASILYRSWRRRRWRITSRSRASWVLTEHRLRRRWLYLLKWLSWFVSLYVWTNLVLLWLHFTYY